MHVLESISMAMGGLGLAVILWGVLIGAFRLVRLEVLRFRQPVSMDEREELRHLMGYYLLLGLEFLVAADIVHTILTPTLEELAVLASIVGIRTVISISINWELKQARLLRRRKRDSAD